MGGRAVALAAAVAAIALLGFLTISVTVRHGVDPLVVVSLLVLALFAFGIVGALLRPPDE
ncbi:MAG: hypothetical protein M3296_05715 [Actinomycetota bacterium]|nr:hypothetical protein [Actinomycetota bacterium]